METKKVFYPEDLDNPETRSIILKARQLWEKECDKYLSTHGDTGTCVIGAGIEVSFLPSKRHRNPRRQIIISASAVSKAQGASVWEESVYRIIKFLKDNGIEADYHSGFMD